MSNPASSTTDLPPTTVRRMRELESQGIHAVMLDQDTGATYSATSGDYFMRDDDDVFLNDAGAPMLLVVERHSFEVV